MSGFLAKQDYFNLAAEGTGLQVKADTSADAHYINEEMDGDGDVADVTTYGLQGQPSNDYELKADLDLDVVLGTLTTIGTGETAFKVALKQVTIKTAGGAAVTVSANGERLPSAMAQDARTIDAGTIVLTKLYKAQIIADSVTISTGNRLLSNDIDINCEMGVTRVEGVAITYDVYNGRIVQALSIVQIGATAPTVTAGTDWTLTKKLTRTNPDAKRPTWTCELTKYLTTTTPVVTP